MSPRQLANLILKGGRTAILTETLRKSNNLFVRLQEFLIPTASHRADSYSLQSEKWSLETYVASDRICGIRVHNIIYDNSVGFEILLPLISFRDNVSWIYNLDKNNLIEYK